MMTREQRREKRRIFSRAAKSYDELTRALEDMRRFLDDHSALWEKTEREDYTIGNLKYDLANIDLRCSSKAEENLAYVLQHFNNLRED